MDESSASEDHSIKTMSSDIEPRRRSLRNQKRSESSSGDSQAPHENGTREQEVQSEQNLEGLAKRRPIRFVKKIQRTESEIIDDALKPLTDDERKAWKGWCELESDPVN